MTVADNSPSGAAGASTPASAAATGASTPGGTSAATPASSSTPGQPRYVDLGASFDPQTSFWSNNPDDMQLNTYFGTGPDDPGLSNQFNMDLKPIIVKVNLSEGNTYLLTDGQGAFFLWNEMDGVMWRFRDSGLSMNDVVYQVRTDTYSQSQLVRQFYNPEGRGAKAAA